MLNKHHSLPGLPEALVGVLKPKTSPIPSRGMMRINLHKTGVVVSFATPTLLKPRALDTLGSIQFPKCTELFSAP